MEHHPAQQLSGGLPTQYAYYLVMTGFGLPWPEGSICLPNDGRPGAPSDPETIAPVEATTVGSV